VSKTTLFGILAIVGGVCVAVAEAFGHPVDQSTQETITRVVAVIVATFFTGGGLIVARDAAK
jgi:drug/metabolite transporter (DMT)-like permease